MHVRKQIRDAVITRLTGLYTTGSKIYEYRVYPISETDLPALMVYTNSESATRLTIGGMGNVASLGRVLSLTIEAYAKQTVDLVATLDDIASEIEVALGSDETLGGLTEDFRLVSTSIDITADGDQPVGVIKLDYDVEYRTTTGDPTTAL